MAYISSCSLFPVGGGKLVNREGDTSLNFEFRGLSEKG